MVGFLDIERFLQGFAGAANQAHHVAVALTGWAQYPDVTAVAEGAAEAADDQAGTGAAADWILAADIYAQRLIRRGFLQPRLQIVQQPGDFLDLAGMHEFRL